MDTFNERVYNKLCTLIRKGCVRKWQRKMEGEKRGEKQGIIKMAKNMLREKIDIETIEKITNLSRKQFM